MAKTLNDLLLAYQHNDMSVDQEQDLQNQIKHIVYRVILHRHQKPYHHIDADDIIGDTWVVLAQKIDDYDPDKCKNPANWISMLSLNVIRTHRRYRQRYLSADITDEYISLWLGLRSDTDQSNCIDDEQYDEQYED